MSRLNRLNLYIGFQWLFFLIRPFGRAAGSNCYYLDGDYAAANEPCRPSEQTSTCCGFTWACLENGLCRSTTETGVDYGEGIYGPPTCTDPKWDSIECFNPCRGLYPINPCGKDQYCCGDCKCDNSTQTFFMPGGDSAFTTIGSLATGSVSIASSVSSLATSASMASSASSLPISASAASSTSFLPTPNPPATPSASNKSMKIGLAVGIPLTALVFGAVAIWVFRHERRSKEQMQEMHARKMPSSYTPTHMNTDPSSQGTSTFIQQDPGVTQPNPVATNELSSYYH